MARNTKRMLQPERWQVQQAGQETTRRWYEAPAVDQHRVMSVVMGGSGRKVEQQPHQTHKHP